MAALTQNPAAENLGLTDLATVIAHDGIANDANGLTDANQTHAVAGLLADILGLTDSVTPTLTGSGTTLTINVIDNLGLTEYPDTYAVDVDDTFTESMTLLDTETPVASTVLASSTVAKLTDFTFALELAPAGTPASAAPSYTAITQYVRIADGISLSRGRDNETDPGAQPGTASVSLLNTDGRFTVGNPSSPYAPLHIRRPCRFTVTAFGSSYPLWQGFVDTWSNGRESSVGVTRVSLSDRVARANKVVMQPALPFEFGLDSPSRLWTLSDAAGRSALDAITGDPLNTLTVATDRIGTGTWSLGDTAGPGYDGQTAFSTTRAGVLAGAYLAVSYMTPLSYASTGSTVSASIRPSVIGSPVLAVDFIYGGIDLAIGVNAQGQAILYSTGLAGNFTLTGSSFLSTTRFTDVAVTVSASTGATVVWTLYVDGVAEAVTSTTVYGSENQYDGIRVGGWDTDRDVALAGWGFFSGDVANLRIYPTALSSTRIRSHADGVADGWEGETSDVRFDRWCAQAGIPSAFYSAANGHTTMAPQAVNDRSLYDVLRDVAEAEGGTLYATKAGVLTLADRGVRYNVPVGLTLDASKTGQVLTGTDLTTDDSLLLNDYTVSTPNGYTARVTDSTSRTDYDTHAEQSTIYTDSPNHALTGAQWAVATRKSPTQRSSGIEVDVVSFVNSGGNIANLLNADQGTRLNVINLPIDTAGTSTLDVFIEGVRHRVDKNQWVITFLTSPVGQYGTTFVLDTNVLDGTAILPY